MVAATKKAKAKNTATAKKSAKKSAKKAAKKTTRAAAVKGSATKKTAKKAAKKMTRRTAGKDAPIDYAALIATIEANARAGGVKLPKGASAAAIAGLEKTLGFALPEEVRAWYLAHDGGGTAFAIEGRQLLSVKGIAGQWKIWKKLLDEGVFGDNDDSEPGFGVQEKWWIPEWVPVTYDGAGNHHAVDMAPGTGGRGGQILSFWHDDPGRGVVGRDFLTWLAGRAWGED